jgi:hypothetical protein
MATVLPKLVGDRIKRREDPALIQGLGRYVDDVPTVGTLYAASCLRERGYAVALFDAMLAESEDEWGVALDRHNPGFAVLYEDNFNYLSKMCLLRMREAALTMVEMAKARGCTVILCGADATDHAGFYLSHGADFVLLGEGEETLAELVDHLTGRAQTARDSILGLAWKESALHNLMGKDQLACHSEPRSGEESHLPWLAERDSHLHCTERTPALAGGARGAVQVSAFIRIPPPALAGFPNLPITRATDTTGHG